MQKAAVLSFVAALCSTHAFAPGRFFSARPALALRRSGTSTGLSMISSIPDKKVRRLTSLDMLLYPRAFAPL